MPFTLKGAVIKFSASSKILKMLKKLKRSSNKTLQISGDFDTFCQYFYSFSHLFFFKCFHYESYSQTQFNALAIFLCP